MGRIIWSHFSSFHPCLGIFDGIGFFWCWAIDSYAQLIFYMLWCKSATPLVSNVWQNAEGTLDISTDTVCFPHQNYNYCIGAICRRHFPARSAEIFFFRGGIPKLGAKYYTPPLKVEKLHPMAENWGRAHLCRWVGQMVSIAVANKLRVVVLVTFDPPDYQLAAALCCCVK